MKKNNFIKRLKEKKQMQQPQININDTTEVKCECGNEFFELTYRMRKISALMAPNGQESFVPVQTMVCRDCNNELQNNS